MAQRKKVVWLLYDADTSIGINNEGALVFDYALEDTDHLEGGAEVYNGQSSVMWNNMRAAFFDEIKTMYQQLRSQGKLSYEDVEKAFEDHQAKWPEAIFNEDAWYKYLAPLVEQGTASYLAMLQGSKAEQRKWWLYNRFRYIDSKYNAGDSLSDVIQLRAYSKGDITVTPYADIYASIKYGSYLEQVRAARNHAYTIECPLDSFNDTEIYIYSASQIASVGDLSPLKVGFADFSMGTRLQSIKLGDSDANYSNSNLQELYLGNNTLLKTIDVRNCGALAQTVDLSGCVNIENIYFDGTSVSGVELPNGGVVKKLHLPDTITSLVLRNQGGITEFVCSDFSNVTTLWLDKPAATIDYVSITEDMASGSRVRITGIDFTVESVDDVADWFDILDTMRGLDEQGNNTETAQISGHIHIDDDVTGAQMVAIAGRYTDVRVTYNSISSELKYYNWEGDTLLYTETIVNGGNGKWATEPTHEPTPANTFVFAGWALTPQATAADANARRAVVADRSVYAAYEVTGRRYTVTWVVDGTTIQTDTNVLYGTTVTYNGTEPTKTDYTFNGWSPTPGPITGDTIYTAVWKYAGSIARQIIDQSITEFDATGYNITKIHMYAFNHCTGLSYVNLPDITMIENVAFSNTKPYGNDKSLVFIVGTNNSQSVATLDSTYAFYDSMISDTSANGYIYVADALVSAYKSATNWSTYADKIKGISEL